MVVLTKSKKRKMKIVRGKDQQRKNIEKKREFRQSFGRNNQEVVSGSRVGQFARFFYLLLFLLFFFISDV